MIFDALPPDRERVGARGLLRRRVVRVAVARPTRPAEAVKRKIS
jgi:hypothetical protein